MSSHGTLCCGEETKKAYQPQNHIVPSLLQPAPFWSGTAIVDLKFQDLSLDDFKEKYLVLLFYPYDFTFICPTELIQFSERIEEFQNIGCEVVAISTDSKYSHLAWIITPRKQGGLGEMKIPVLSDKNHEISRTYGVLDEKQGISLKALFIIDQKQLIRHVTLNEIALSRSVDEVLRVLQACQFIDKFGDTCPIGPKETPSSLEEPNYFSTNVYTNI